MRRFPRLFAVLPFIGLICLLPVSLSATENEAVGVISGSTLNGTTGERVAGVEVTLRRYERGEHKDEKKMISDLQGKFYFSELEQGEGQGYILQAVYKGVEYNSPIIALDDRKRDVSFDMTVYETTGSDETISVVMHHVLAEPKEGAMWVKEVMIVENKDNKVFVGAREIAPDRKETLRISLPPRAQELEVLRGLMSCCIVQLDDGFADTMDIKPGRKEIIFAYKIDYRDSRLSLAKRVNLMTNSLDFFMPDRGVRARGENIEYVGLVGEPGNRFIHFSGKKLAKGSHVILSFEGLPWRRKVLGGIAPIAGVALLGLGLIYPLIRRRKELSGAEMETRQESPGKSMLEEERQSILLAMAELDDQLAAGHISPEEHSRRRHLLKDRAVQITELLQNRAKSEIETQ